jgi:hypothetical protein
MFAPEYNLKIALRPFYGAAGFLYLVVSGLEWSGLVTTGILEPGLLRRLALLQWPKAFAVGTVVGLAVLTLEYLWINKRGDVLVDRATDSPIQGLKGLPHLYAAPEPWLIWAVMVGGLVASFHWRLSPLTFCASFMVPLGYVGPHVREIQRRIREKLLDDRTALARTSHNSLCSAWERAGTTGFEGIETHSRRYVDSCVRLGWVREGFWWKKAHRSRGAFRC